MYKNKKIFILGMARSGYEVAKLLAPDNKILITDVKPGETKTVTLKLKGSDLAFVGYDGKWRLEKGDFKIKCGDQWIDIVCDQTKVWNTPNKNTLH